MSLGRPLLEAAREAHSVFAGAGIASIIIGGIALSRWGEPRLTRDVDFTVLCRLGDEGPLIDRVLASLGGRIANAADFARNNRVILAQAINGVPIDIAIGGLPFEERAIARGSPFEFAPGLRMPTCSAEDLIVMKGFAGRPQDLVDIKGVVLRQRNLDWTLVKDELLPLLDLKASRETWDTIEAMRGDPSAER